MSGVKSAATLGLDASKNVTVHHPALPPRLQNVPLHEAMRLVVSEPSDWTISTMSYFQGHQKQYPASKRVTITSEVSAKSKDLWLLVL